MIFEHNRNFNIGILDPFKKSYKDYYANPYTTLYPKLRLSVVIEHDFKESGEYICFSLYIFDHIFQIYTQGN